jgi:drug/metabolite transporter (DMT)-like permease
MWQRVSAILITIIGLLMAVLGVVSENDSSIRIIGAVIMLAGVIWLYRQPLPSKQHSGDIPPLRWYQSPLLWIPIIAIVLFLISLAL